MRDSSLNGSACVPIAACTRPTPEIEDGVVRYFEEDISSRDSREVNGQAGIVVSIPTQPVSAAEASSICIELIQQLMM